MISVIIEAVWLAVKKLFQYFGIAAVLLIALFICASALPNYAREEARIQAMYQRSVEFISLEEIEPTDYSRVFKLRFKNNDSDTLNGFLLLSRIRTVTLFLRISTQNMRNWKFTEVP